MQSNKASKETNIEDNSKIQDRELTKSITDSTESRPDLTETIHEPPLIEIANTDKDTTRTSSIGLIPTPELGIDDPDDWPAEFDSLRQLDHQFRCPICHEFLSGSVMSIICSHIFCSLCIRRALNIKKQCPCCFGQLVESNLLSIKFMDSLVNAFTRQRKMVLEAVRDSLSSVDAILESHQANCASPENPSKIELPTKNVLKKNECDIRTTEDQSHFLSPKKVSCPNCSTLIIETSINRHLDMCLEAKSSRKPHSIQNPFNLILKSRIAEKRLPKPSKLVYSMMSEAKLRKVLKDLGLPSTGNKKAMEARHIEWISMYNANEDSLHPKSHKRLLQELNTWENTLLKDIGTPTHNGERMGLAKEPPSYVDNTQAFEELKRRAKQTLFFESSHEGIKKPKK